MPAGCLRLTVLRCGRAGRVHPDIRGCRDPRGADSVRADHGLGERLGGSAAQHRPDRVTRQRRLLEPAQQPAWRTWHAGAPTDAGPAPKLCAAARPWVRPLRRSASPVLRVLQARREEVARCLEAAMGAAQVAGRSWNQQHSGREPGGASSGCPDGPCARAGRRTGLPMPVRECLVRRADTGAAREGRAGRGQLHGGAGRADSTPGALWLDGAAKVVAGEEQRLAGHHGPVLCLALSGDRLFSSSTDLTIKVHPRALRHGEPSDLPCSCSPACRTMIRPVLTMRLHASAFTASVLTMRLHAPPGNPC